MIPLPNELLAHMREAAEEFMKAHPFDMQGPTYDQTEVEGLIRANVEYSLSQAQELYETATKGLVDENRRLSRERMILAQLLKRLPFGLLGELEYVWEDWVGDGGVVLCPNPECRGLDQFDGEGNERTGVFYEQAKQRGYRVGHVEGCAWLALLDELRRLKAVGS